MPSRPLLNRFGRGALPLVATSAATLIVLSLALLAWRGAFQSQAGSGIVRVFCAAGVMPAVKPVAEQYEQEFDVRIELHTGSSGSLEAQIRALEGLRSGDLYIPAAEDPFVDRNRIGSAVALASEKTPFIAEVIPLAEFRLVLAAKSQQDKSDKETKIDSFESLFHKDVTLLIGNDKTAIGKKTKQALQSVGLWQRVDEKAREQDTVTILAMSLRGDANTAGFIWDANARQAGLDIIDIPELTSKPSRISAGVLANAENPTGALRFARYLAAADKGQQSFENLHYETVAGDPWAETPEVVLFSGGLNQEAIRATLEEFKQREGCKITTTYSGCGVLVAKMREGETPDAYFACDTSYLTQVQDRFNKGVNVSKTDMVMLVHKDFVDEIKTLADMGRRDDNFQPRIGTAHEELSALGGLTVKLLKERGIYESVVKNRKATPSTAPDLVLQVTNGALDAAIVYRANCKYIGESAVIVSIDDPLAGAEQPFAINRKAKFPQLTQRLLDAISSTKSRKRFEDNSFRWQLGGGSE